MNEKLKAQYNNLYTAQNDVFGGGKPAEAVCRLKEYLRGGTLLDIGGGEGRNAVYLAEQGFIVSVLDFSEVAVERVKLVAKERGVMLQARVFDVTSEEIDSVFDGCVVTFVLHHFETVVAERVIRKAKQHTSTGGVHVLMTFSNQGVLYERNRTSGRFYPSVAEIQALYTDWEILELETCKMLTLVRDNAGQRQKNTVVTMVARKKQS
jgi:tellurite methyltransferase